MKPNLRTIGFFIFFLCAISMMAGNKWALPQDDPTRRQQQSNRSPQDDPTRARNNRNNRANNRSNNNGTPRPNDRNNGNKADDNRKGVNDSIKAQPIIETDEEIPDSLLHPRWRIQRTQPISDEDLMQGSADLQRPENMKQTVEYNDTIERYIIGNKVAGTYVFAPTMMTFDEYLKWSEKKMLYDFFRSKNEEALQTKGKEKFDFLDMHFDLGPAEKIFGPGGVRIKTQGTAELKFGATFKNIDNPSLPIRNRKTTTMDFDEKINLNVNGKVGDKVNMNINYNTDATFNFDAQSMKLKYDGKEDEIIKLVEGGNVSFPGNSSLITGASSLFGLRTDFQFGKLKLQTVISQKKSNSTSVSSKGGVQLTPFEIDAANYEENRHFFLSHYFRGKYDGAMKTLPNLTTGITINRMEIWVTNKTGNNNNTRNIIALPLLGEGGKDTPPSNNSNSLYSQLTTSMAAARDIDQTSSVLDAQFVGGVDYEKLEQARLLNSSEYTVNNALGYVSLKTTLQTDQVLAVAYEYTYGGVTYQVGEFASDVTDVNKCLFVKSLKNTSNNPQQANWDLMMKNVYYLASSVEKDKFRLDIKFQSDTAGVYLTYIPEPQVKDQTIIKDIDADRLDNNMKAHPNGYFDYVAGYTVTNGRVFLPKAEPFGEHLYKFLVSKGVDPATAQKYSYTELYDSTKTVARQIAEKDKYILTGHFRGSSANVISLGAYNVPQGSVEVTANGVKLTEGSDYTVDYSAGEVTIINQSILDAQPDIKASCESNTDYGQSRKTMFGLNWEYDFSKNFQLSGTFRHLSEQSLTTKVPMGAEPLNNTVWGVNLNWKKESQWLTNMLDKLPLLHVTQPSNISLSAEFAQLIAGQAHGTQDNASYLDDFENTKNTIDVSTPTSWIISSCPTMFGEYKDKTGLTSSYNRSLLAWYNIDPLFTRRSSSLTPGHIKSDLDQLSNHYVREVYVRELYPNRDQSSYSGATSTLPVLNLAFYPEERGPYNFNTELNAMGRFDNPQNKWGGMMRKLDTNDFETANIEYIEFWLLDPFIYTNGKEDASEYGGDFYINLGEVSEDILRDGKKFHESGMPVDGSSNYAFTQWGKTPTTTTYTYAFAVSGRSQQDVGYNGLTDQEEQTFDGYQEYLNALRGKVSQEVWDSIYADPANDDYHYFRGSDYDQVQASILQRYKRINNPQGNTPDSEMRSESYDTSYKTTPDVEDINQDNTLNEYEKYYQYHVSIRPEDLVVGHNFIVDSRVGSGTLRNGERYDVTWYQFRIPLDRYEQKVGAISDFTSVRFMRMFLTNFKKPIVMRFGSLDLVRGEWRVYTQNLTNGSTNSGYMSVSAVNIEENNDKTPVNYILPPGISRVQDPTQPQLVESNEQALDIVVNDLGTGESKCVYKNTSLDLRQYRRLQMFTHANTLNENTTNLADDQLAVFIRLGSDYKSNYYEYEVPLKLTPAGHYDKYSATDKRVVWPEENMVDIPLEALTAIKKERNRAKAEGMASYNQPFHAYDEDRPANKITVMGNPSLGEVKTMIIGVRNLSGEAKSGEVWVNELRLKEYNNEGGWAAQGNLNVQLSDFGTINVAGRYTSEGFGGLEDGVAARSKDNMQNYTVTTQFELGKFFPDKAKVSAPLYYSYSNQTTKPKYNPLDTDMELDDALEAMDKHERDSIESIVVKKVTSSSFSLSNVRVGVATKGHPMPYDPANFSFSYSHQHTRTTGETIVYEDDSQWNGSLSYSWSPVYKSWEPFKKIKSKSKWLEFPKKLGFNYLPQNITFNTDIKRLYYELQERDMESLEGSQLPLSFSEQFLWNRDFSIRWDFTKNLHLNFSSGTHAEIEEPYTPINKDLYPDHYTAWKDSVWTSIRNLGTPLDYAQNFKASYHVPLNLIPIFDWVTSDVTYDANYSWVRGTQLEDGTTLGNTITNNRTFNINGTFNMQKLYDHVPFLKKANERFSKSSNATNAKKNTKTSSNAKKPKDDNKKDDGKEDGKEADDKSKAQLPKNKNTFEKEITIKADTSLVVSHGKKSKRLVVTAKNKDGKTVPVKYKVVDDNKIKVINKTDSAVTLKISVTPKQPLDDKAWYKTAQVIARGLMMVRNINFTYRDQRAMSLPGFMPTIGSAFGQRRGDILSPGLDFAFGFTDEDYIEKARRNNWLLCVDNVATPSTTNATKDLQLKMTLEPARDFKIDLNASRTETDARSIQYMYVGNPTTRSGQFTITTISLRSALEGMGSASNGYHSPSFVKFCNSLPDFRNRVEAQYAGSTYPVGTPMAGQAFNPEVSTVGLYSSDVLIPAFISTYTNIGGKSLDLFPSLARMLPNWTIRYSGLSKLAPFRDLFKSVNINHSYKSIFAVGSYASFSTWLEYMDGLGFITDATTGMPTPSSMFNISTVSINESFSPLIGVDVTLNNNLTCKLEYRDTRVLTLSTTSVQINETTSKDFVLGFGYKINDFKFFSLFGGGARKVKGKKGNSDSEDNNNKSQSTSRNSKQQFNHDLNLRCDVSYKKQANITRDIASMTSQASSGSTAFKFSFNADYTISKLMTMTFYFDSQTNTPLLTSSSYPTTTRDFGLSLKFSLTR